MKPLYKNKLKMSNFSIFLLVLLPFSVFAQSEYEITGFSEKYKAKLIIEKGYEDKGFKKGEITILDTKTNAEIITLESDEFTFDLDEHGDIKTNILQTPYGEQSIIISRDFNFDGKKDLAIKDGTFSCYHGPSFQIYLETDNGLKHSPEFTRLAQEYCGMFQLDHETQTIHTMTKSGCCWHQLSDFKVIDGIPKAVLIVEEDATDLPFYTTKTIKWNGGKRKEIIEKSIDLQEKGITEIVSFKLAKSQKKAVLFSISDQTLHYVLIKPSGLVEFSYPLKTIYENPDDFHIDQTGNSLTFKNKGAVYQIYENRKAEKLVGIGVLVTVNGKKYDLAGDINSLKGTLRNAQKNLDNVVIE